MAYTPVLRVFLQMQKIYLNPHRCMSLPVQASVLDVFCVCEYSSLLMPSLTYWSLFPIFAFLLWCWMYCRWYVLCYLPFHTEHMLQLILLAHLQHSLQQVSMFIPNSFVLIRSCLFLSSFGRRYLIRRPARE